MLSENKTLLGVLLLTPPNSKIEQSAHSIDYLLHTGWHTNLPHIQGADNNYASGQFKLLF